MRTSERCFRYALTLSESEVLITTTEFLPRVTELAGELPALRRVLLVDGSADAAGLGFDIVDLRTVLAEVTVETEFQGPEVWDVSTLLFTSGTTGPSKAVVSPWGLTYNMWSWVPEDTLGPGEALFLALPLFHNSGRSGFNYVLSRGGCLVTRAAAPAGAVALHPIDDGARDVRRAERHQHLVEDDVVQHLVAARRAARARSGCA